VVNFVKLIYIHIPSVVGDFNDHPFVFYLKKLHGDRDHMIKNIYATNCKEMRDMAFHTPALENQCFAS